MQAYKYGEGRKGTRRTSHLLDKQLEVASRYESNEGDGERDGSGYEYLRWDHPRLCAVCCVLCAVCLQVISGITRSLLVAELCCTVQTGPPISDKYWTSDLTWITCSVDKYCHDQWHCSGPDAMVDLFEVTPSCLVLESTSSTGAQSPNGAGTPGTMVLMTMMMSAG